MTALAQESVLEGATGATGAAGAVGTAGADRGEAWLQKALRRRPMLIGGALFAVVSAAGIATSVKLARGGAIWPALRSLDLPLALLLAVLVAADWYLGGLRLWIFARAVAPRVTLLDAVRANLANMFLGAVTPSQSGGGPAHVYMLWRAGVPVACGLALSVINFVATLAMLLAAALFIVWQTPTVLPAVMQGTLHYSFVAFSVLLGVFVAALAAPRLVVGRTVRGLEALAPRVSRRTGRVLEMVRRTLERGLQQYEHGLATFAGRRRLVPASLALTLLLYFNKCLIGVVVARALGIPAGFWNIIAAQVLVIFVSYFAPTPGASFVAEVSSTYLMGYLADTNNLAAFTMLCRLASVWLAVIVGGVVLGQQLRRDAVVQ